jgi:hypothetical protein
MKRLGLASLVVICSLSLLINVLQGRRIHLLQVAIGSVPSRTPHTIGSTLSSFRALDLEGRGVTVDFKSVSIPTVIYIFRPSCVWCERNSRSLQSLIEQIGNKYRIVGLSLSGEGLHEFARRHNMSFPIYLAQEDVIASLRLGLTPETIVVSSKGTILGSWNGAYNDLTRTSLTNFFAVVLPQELQN